MKLRIHKSAECDSRKMRYRLLPTSIARRGPKRKRRTFVRPPSRRVDSNSAENTSRTNPSAVRTRSAPLSERPSGDAFHGSLRRLQDGRLAERDGPRSRAAGSGRIRHGGKYRTVLRDDSRNCAAVSVRSSGLPAAIRSETAFDLKLGRVILRLEVDADADAGDDMARRSSSALDSSRMPLILRPSMSRSFGHLMPISRPVCRRSDRQSAAAVSSVSCGVQRIGTFGRSTRLIHSPLSFGDSQLRPILPRPLVCCSRNDKRAFGRPFFGEPLRGILGRADLVVQVKRPAERLRLEARHEPGRRQPVRRSRQPISPVAARFDRVAFLRQPADMFPDRRPADAEPAARLFARNVLAFAFRQAFPAVVLSWFVLPVRFIVQNAPAPSRAMPDVRWAGGRRPSPAAADPSSA